MRVLTVAITRLSPEPIIGRLHAALQLFFLDIHMELRQSV